ncbi:MAG TPA: right-handed parallel beta-helix repeat-containing protein [Candidatus Limnocylindrales bacterium]
MLKGLVVVVMFAGSVLPPVGGYAAAVLDLDPGGGTVPDSNYPIPTGAVFMDDTGNDAAAGTRSSPVRTLNRAVAIVPAGGTIVVRAGIYRDWYRNAAATGYAIVPKGVTIQSFPHEQVWFDGTDVVPAGWVGTGGGRWSRDWSTPQLCDGKYYQAHPASQGTGPCTRADMDSSPQAPIPGDPQMVFVNGVQLEQKPTLAEVGASTFFYDWAARRIHIGVDPAGKLVELAVRPVALVLGSAGNTVRGLGFRRFASNEFDGNLTRSAVYMGGGAANRVENVVFTENAAGGLTMSNPRPGSFVRSSVFARNGFTALSANGGTSSGTRNDFVIEGNVFDGNNAEEFGWTCTVSCAQANVKLGHMFGFRFTGNVTQNAAGRLASGFWCDLDCREGVIARNLTRDNGGYGIYYEVSGGGIIASNLAVGNGLAGIGVPSANTKVWNNTLVDNQFGIWVYDDRRAPGVGGWNDIGPNTSDVELVNNVVSDQPYYLVKTSDPTADLPVNTRPSQYYRQFDYNAYHRVNGASQNLYNWIEGADVYYRSSASFTAAKGWDAHAIDIAGGGDPFFVNRLSGDFRVRAGSPAYRSGKPLPADVAAVLGLPPGAVTSRGAIAWATP